MLDTYFEQFTYRVLSPDVNKDKGVAETAPLISFLFSFFGFMSCKLVCAQCHLRSINQSIDRSINQSINQSIRETNDISMKKKKKMKKRQDKTTKKLSDYALMCSDQGTLMRPFRDINKERPETIYVSTVSHQGLKSNRQPIDNRCLKLVLPVIHVRSCFVNYKNLVVFENGAC